MMVFESRGGSLSGVEDHETFGLEEQLTSAVAEIY